MKIPSHTEFVRYIKSYLDVKGEKPSSFGRRVLGDSGAINRLMSGTDPRLSTMNKINEAIERGSDDIST